LASSAECGFEGPFRFTHWLVDAGALGRPILAKLPARAILSDGLMLWLLGCTGYG